MLLILRPLLFCPGLIQPELLPDGQVCVDMGQPVLDASKVPTTLQPTQDTTVVEQRLTVDGRTYAMTCVSMGNPHAITYSVDGQPIKVCWHSLQLGEAAVTFGCFQVVLTAALVKRASPLSPARVLQARTLCLTHGLC